MTRHAMMAALAGLALAAGCAKKEREPGTLRLGFFPNLTHGAALVGLQHGDFARALAPIKVEARPFNAGPEAMEALLAGALDACYVGPAPAINTYLRSRGEGLVIVAGAALNGAGLVARKEAQVGKPDDLRGKKVASPQLGNTQDVALRVWLHDHGMKPKDRGGDVRVLPLANADILALMKQKQLDAAWVPEPWTSRLILEANGVLFLDERELWPGRRFPTTVLVVTQKLAREHPDEVQQLVNAHLEAVTWTRAHSDEARGLVAEGLQKWAKKALPPAVLEAAWKNVEISAELLEPALQKQLADGRSLGFLPAEGDVTHLVDRRFLDAASRSSR